MEDIRITSLTNDQIETEQEILERIWTLIDAKWDARTIQFEIQNLMLQREGILKELDEISYKS
ncbi:hypothetical protein [Nitrosopumilus sp.]|uniref:hypothetical protein n=1 Tax=Nitrosopumilus sp. TaxID=2024843 RepID=UPI003B5962D0